MARQVTYLFKGKRKTIQFSYNVFHDLYEAVADAEDVDLKSFLAMEKQLALSCRGQGIVKNFRQTEFTRMGFSDIKFVRDEETLPVEIKKHNTKRG
ncbi:DUF2960 domain-containing protein [Psychromonas antarctica]|jgi:hypothetical protein|uniref:DUF2960 domain-containing protein n=1 Tax=Psychromonas antarctica TaxID=67573 RepID=UPI001EE9012A|nr:DUF2960 domain-containing protein [Psychromonas antarctica]MCG6200660.1 DUF2960 domain-containing protein [Psychromonas antarctica]